MILIVTGSREANEFDSATIIRATIAGLGGVDEIWHGKCPTGADKAADVVGEQSAGVKVKPFPANWKLLGKAAGHERNGVMIGTAHYQRLNKGKDFMVLAIFAKGAENKGTGNCVEHAIHRQLPIDIRWVSRRT